MKAATAPRRPLLRALVALACVGVLLLCAALAFGPEHWWPLAQAQYLPWPLVMAPAALALLASLRLGRAWRVAALAAFAAVAVVVMDLEANWQAPEGRRVRIMTYNVKAYLGLQRPDWPLQLAHEVALHDPDILVMQDAGQLDRLEPETLRAIVGMRTYDLRGQYLIASRDGVRECRLGDIPYRGERHTYSHCVVEAHGAAIDVFTAHFVTPRDGLSGLWRGLGSGSGIWRRNVEDRMEQSQRLARQLGERRRPLVLAGDFNAPASSLVLRGLESAGLRNAFSTAGQGYGHTYGHSFWPGLSFLRLDHILVSEEFRVHDAFVGGKQASSHRPVVADVSLAGRG